MGRESARGYNSIFFHMGCEQSQLNKIEDEEMENKDGQQEEFQLTYRQFVMNSRGDVFQFYHFSNFIHRSPSSIIRTVFHRSNKVQRVCKIVPMEKFGHLAALQEVEILKTLQHPNICTLHEYFIQKNHAYLIFNKVEGLNLLQLLKGKNEISLKDVLSIMSQLLSVISMLRKEKIAHRAINPGHIMLDMSSQGSYLLKVIDFSHAARVDQKNLKAVRPYVDSAYNSNESKTHPFEHDIYCCGLIFMTLLGGHGFMTNIRSNEVQNIGMFMEESPQLKHLEGILRSMLSEDPTRRPTPISVLNDPSLKINTVGSDQIKILFKNLLRFNIKGKLRSTLWMFASITLNNKKERFQFLSEFYTLDSNRDGKIQYQELCEGLMNSFGINRQEAEEQTTQIFKNLDKNNNGCLDFYEFILGTFSVGRALSDHELKIIFTQIDTNKDGVITEEELNNAVDGIEEFDLLERTDRQLNFKLFKQVMKTYITRLSEQQAQE